MSEGAVVLNERARLLVPLVGESAKSGCTYFFFCHSDSYINAFPSPLALIVSRTPPCPSKRGVSDRTIRHIKRNAEGVVIKRSRG
jgi:hypothetical protein